MEILNRYVGLFVDDLTKLRCVRWRSVLMKFNHRGGHIIWEDGALYWTLSVRRWAIRPYFIWMLRYRYLIVGPFILAAHVNLTYGESS